MKNLILVCSAILLTLSSAFAQDKLMFLNGDEQEVKILEVGSSEVKYKRLNNLEGPTFTTAKSELFLIKYANGDKDVMEHSAETSSKEESISTASSPDLASEPTDKWGRTEAQNRAMAQAALADAERVEAEHRAELEAPAKAEKAKGV